MKTKLVSAVAVVAAAFLLVTNPVVVEAAGKITGKQIKDNSVTGKDIKDGSLLSGDFGTGQVPAGAQGVQGVQGPAGPTGPIKVQSTQVTAIPADAVGVFGFVGTPVTMTLTAQSSLVGSGVATLHTAAGSAMVLLDLCTQVGAAALVSASGFSGQYVTVDTGPVAYPMTGVSGALPAGTYKVGYCAELSSAAIPADGDNNWVSAWFQAVPPTTVSRPAPGRAAARVAR